MENRVPFFSKNRWGPGSILVIMILVLLDLLFLLLYFEYQYRPFLALFIIVLLSAIIIIIVKGAENVSYSSLKLRSLLLASRSTREWMFIEPQRLAG
ncbi:MAG: hypothetical protein ACP5RZ_03385 [Thermoplasmata archaeon]